MAWAIVSPFCVLIT